MNDPLKDALSTVFDRPESSIVYMAIVETPVLYPRVMQIIANCGGRSATVHDVAPALYKFFRVEYNPLTHYELYQDLLMLPLLRVEWIKLAHVFLTAYRAGAPDEVDEQSA